MSSIGTDYDQNVGMFSPDGRIFQVEYAQKAVDSSGNMIAIGGRNGVVTAVDKPALSVLHHEHASPRICSVSDYIGITMNGWYPDCFCLKAYSADVAKGHLKAYREPMPIQKLVDKIGEYMHLHTGYSGLRPFGANAFFSSWDKMAGGRLFLAEVSGLVMEYRSWAVGKNRQEAKAEMEKLKMDELSMEQMVKEAARIIMMIREESGGEIGQVEFGWVGDVTNGRHERVPLKVIALADEWAQMKLEEDDMD